MIDDLKSLAIFREVAKLGSFRAASHSLKLSPSVISQHVSNLESKLATKLLHRTTRKLQLTDSGTNLQHYADAMVNKAQMGFLEVAKTTGELTGQRNITLPSALLGSSWLVDISAFASSQPKLQLNLEFTDTQLDLVDNNIDLAFRTGQLSDSLLKCKKIGAIPRTLVASPEYIQKHALPRHIKDLQNLPWVHLNRLPAKRDFISQQGEQVTVKLNPAISVNSVIALKELTLQGLGLSTPPHHQIQKELQEGSLVALFPDWKIPDIPLYLVWLDSPENGLLVSRLSQFFSAPDGE